MAHDSKNTSKDSFTSPFPTRGFLVLFRKHCDAQVTGTLECGTLLDDNSLQNDCERIHSPQDTALPEVDAEECFSITYLST
jgi:hypothetical protein